MPETAITIGTFDGLHYGHRSLFKKMQKYSKRIAFVFDLPPRYYLGKIKQDKFLLTTFKEREFILEKWSFKVQKLNKATLKLTAKEFFNYILEYRPKAIFLGKEFKFGKLRRGNIEILKKWCKKKEIKLISLLFKKKGKKISSGLLRENIDDFNLIKKFMPYYIIRGKVIKGHGYGSKIGFPTINILTDSKKLLPKGVFAGYIYLDNKFKKAVINIGNRPTLNLGFSVEIHILEKFIEKPKYVFTFLTDKIRNEKKFNNINELKLAIKKDVNKAKKILKNFDILKI
ncbi:MAG: hypothetical protein NZ870_04930 [bacterium]|nr:hypothetical protein [bacterium]